RTHRFARPDFRRRHARGHHHAGRSRARARNPCSRTRLSRNCDQLTPMAVDTTLITASAAALGSLVGAAATVATTWMTQRSQFIRGHTEWKLRERESLYGDFIKEASRLAVDALDHTLDEPEKLVALYGTLGRIRLISGDQVLHEAEECCRLIFELYSQPNLTP